MDPIAAELHQDALVIDGVCPLMQDPAHWDDWIAGGVDVAIPTVANEHGPADTMKNLSGWFRWMRSNGDRLAHVVTVEDITKAKEAGRLGVIFHFQDTAPLGGNVDHLEVFDRLGVKMIQLCYNRRNQVGDGCLEPADSGLSQFGRNVISEMNRLGIIVDLSHTGYRTTMEAIDLSVQPPVFSHSNVYTLCNSRRNIKDDQIKAVAATGGLVGVAAFPAFLRQDRDTSVIDLVDHVDYLVEMIGPDHVALGLDYYDGGSPSVHEEMVRTGMWTEDEYPPCPHQFPTGLEDPSKFPTITVELLRRGYPEDSVRKILGLNWMRVFQAVWRSI
jgi:membrane dipeptidase